mgnify:CR=1 FL=1
MATFALFGSWAGWHGRWRTPIWTTGAMLAGFALTLLAPSVLWACVGLALFGVGLGGIYTGALYYVMEVGASEVEAGGTHEALIGGGYALGPAIGLAGLWLASDGVAGSRLTSSQATVLLALGAGVLAAGVAAWAALRGNRRAR